MVQPSHGTSSFPRSRYSSSGSLRAHPSPALRLQFWGKLLDSTVLGEEQKIAELWAKEKGQEEKWSPKEEAEGAGRGERRGLRAR